MQSYNIEIWWVKRDKLPTAHKVNADNIGNLRRNLIRDYLSKGTVRYIKIVSDKGQGGQLVRESDYNGQPFYLWWSYNHRQQYAKTVNPDGSFFKPKRRK